MPPLAALALKHQSNPRPSGPLPSSRGSSTCQVTGPSSALSRHGTASLVLVHLKQHFGPFSLLRERPHALCRQASYFGPRANPDSSRASHASQSRFSYPKARGIFFSFSCFLGVGSGSTRVRVAEQQDPRTAHSGTPGGYLGLCD